MKIKGMYILECSDNSFYVGSSKDIFRRLEQHQSGEGSLHTQARLPVKLVYYEEFKRIDKAFKREHVVKDYSRAKKIALINNKMDDFKKASRGKNRPYKPKKKDP